MKQIATLLAVALIFALFGCVVYYYAVLVPEGIAFR